MASDTPQGWWMYQGGPAHGGYVTDTPIDSSNAATLETAFTVQLDGPVLSVPAVTDGYAYVGVANNHKVPGSNGGGLYRVELATGQVAPDSFTWTTVLDQRDSHGFTGMGCTPAVVNGNVYFVAFDGWMYCVRQDNLAELVWKTNLRQADPAQNQPVTNDFPPHDPSSYPPAAGWSSPVVAGDTVYVGMGEGENPQLFGFVYALAADTGRVRWIFCTNQLADGRDNQPNEIPALTVQPAGTPLPPGYTAIPQTATYTQPRGASVWSGIAFSGGLLYVTTGNPANCDNGLPAPPPPWTDPHAEPGCVLVPPVASAPKYSYSVLILDAATGALKAQFLPTQDTSYRPSDTDIDFGGSAALFTQNGKQVVAVACKNGSLFLLDAATLQLIRSRQLLPYDTSGRRIPSVDPHPLNGNLVNPSTTPNCDSDGNPGENYSGVFGAPAVDPVNGIVFVGMGGPNYHNASPGIDYQSTPFMRAVKWDTLEDAWPLEPYTFQLNTGPVTVMRYGAEGAGAAMYQNPGEASVGSPAIANDVVFVGTHNVSLYAFHAATGRKLWSDDMGMQTLGINGGYGYCMGPAVWQNYVVAGALVQGRDGGLLRIYRLKPGGGAS
ncbi:MAG TPA: PQQ-binding-like beta-propeller repeat protein [Longimicrobium sp.]|jgi:outer membrane protein assembly factor BamB